MMKCLAIYISHQTLLNAKELKLLNFVKSDITEQMNCESNLKISRGRTIKVPEKVVSSIPGAQSVAGPPAGGT